MRELFHPDPAAFTFPYRVEDTHPRAVEMCAEKLTQALGALSPGSELVCFVSAPTVPPAIPSVPWSARCWKKWRLPPYAFTEHWTSLFMPSTFARRWRKCGGTLKNPRIIAVDACLGHLHSVGSIQVGMGPLKPGAGVNKKLPEVGEVHITGIVNVAGFMEYFVLQNTRLSIVMKMADIISRSIQSVASRLHREVT